GRRGVPDPFKTRAPGAPGGGPPPGLRRRALSFEGTPSSAYSVLDITVRRGSAGGGGGDAGFRDGAGVRLEAGSLLLENVRLEGHVAASGDGGGVYSASGTSLRLVRSTVSGNRALRGGGLYAAGDVTLEKTTVSANASQGEGGGLYGAGALRLFESTVSGNGALGAGLPVGRGGGVFIGEAGLLLSSHSTVVANRALVGPGISLLGTAGSVAATVIAGNLTTDTALERNCGAPLGVVDGRNLSGDASCGFTGPSDLEDTDPDLWPLMRLGGLTATHVPRTSSPVIDAAGVGFCVEVDQRDAPRPVDAGGGPECDIGAVEFTPDTDGGVVFVEGFETGNLSAWSGVVP
ncbi:MAG: choice-of-anchor Q domain-containing protein, partial [Acidobacteriota bacterium]